MTGRFLVRVLGPVDVLVGDDQHTIGSRNQRALIAALALGAGRAVPVHQLRDVVWGALPPPSADASLQTYVSRLRSVVGHEAIERVGDAYRLSVTRRQIDATVFEDLVDDASDARSDPERCAAVSRRALVMWRGQPFGDLGDDEAFRLEALRLDELRVAAMELALDAEIALGHHDVAAAELRSAVDEHPYRERIWYLLAEALRRDGRRIEALRTCDRLRHVLADAGLEPGPELGDLERRILGLDPN